MGRVVNINFMEFSKFQTQMPKKSIKHSDKLTVVTVYRKVSDRIKAHFSTNNGIFQ